MPDGIPVWVTTIVLPVAIIIAFGVIVTVVLVLTLRRFTETIIVGLIGQYGKQVDAARDDVASMEAIHADARKVLVSMAAFEMDTSLPLKLRQQAAGLRVAQLTTSYEQAVKALRFSNKTLTDARHNYDIETYASFRQSYREQVVRTLAAIKEQEARLIEIEQQLDQANAAYEKLVRPLRAV